MSPERSNLEALRLLFPLDLGGDHAGDQLVEGAALDAAQAAGDALVSEMFPYTATWSLPSWERVYAVVPASGEPLQSRRDKVVAKMREKGGLSIAYFTSLCEALGFQVEIEEPLPFMAGWAAAGDELFVPEIVHQWGVLILNQPIYQFRAGESGAGEALLWWSPQTHLENLINKLKEADTYVYFVYSE